MQDSQWFKDKIRASDIYAQNVYAALCNMQWQPLEVVPILKNETWSCTWRSAGGIVADLRSKGEDYMDYYCSGMGGVAALPEEIGDEDRLEAEFAARGHVSEGTVTDEIREDFLRLGSGWVPVPYDDKDMI